MSGLTWLTRRAAHPAGAAQPAGLVIAALVLVAVIALAVLPGYTGQYGLLVAFEIVQLAALAQAWSLMAGYGGIVSLAVAAFVGVGSYATAEVSSKAGLGLYPSVLAGGVVAVLFAAAVAVPMLRFRGLYFTIGSLVLAEALGIFMSNFGGFGGNMGITLSGTAPSPETIYLLSFVVAVLATGIVAGLVRSRLGLGLRAIRDDEDVAERVGVLTFRTKLTVFLIASFVMGLVGGIQAQWTGYIEPTGAFALDWTVETVNAAIIGGVGHDRRAAARLGHLGRAVPAPGQLPDRAPDHPGRAADRGDPAGAERLVGRGLPAGPGRAAPVPGPVRCCRPSHPGYPSHPGRHTRRSSRPRSRSRHVHHLIGRRLRSWRGRRTHHPAHRSGRGPSHHPTCLAAGGRRGQGLRRRARGGRCGPGTAAG